MTPGSIRTRETSRPGPGKLRLPCEIDRYRLSTAQTHLRSDPSLHRARCGRGGVTLHERDAALAAGDRVLEALRRHSPEYFGDEADYERQRRLLRASLLLHDIGHGPFSHACEAVLGTPHEQRTPEILRQPEIIAALGRLHLEAEEVLELVIGSPNPRYPVLRELVSGPNLDVDRMDYL